MRSVCAWCRVWRGARTRTPRPTFLGTGTLKRVKTVFLGRLHATSTMDPISDPVDGCASCTAVRMIRERRPADEIISAIQAASGPVCPMWGGASEIRYACETTPHRLVPGYLTRTDMLRVFRALVRAPGVPAFLMHQWFVEVTDDIDTDAAQELVDAGMPLDVPFEDFRCDDFIYPIHWIAQVEDDERLVRMVTTPATVNLVASNGYTPLDVARSYNNDMAERVFLEMGEIPWPSSEKRRRRLRT